MVIVNNIMYFAIVVKLITMNADYCLIFFIKIILNFTFLFALLEYQNTNNQLQGLLFLA